MRFRELPLSQVVVCQILTEKEKPQYVTVFIRVGHKGNGNIQRVTTLIGDGIFAAHQLALHDTIYIALKLGLIVRLDFSEYAGAHYLIGVQVEPFPGVFYWQIDIQILYLHKQ